MENPRSQPVGLPAHRDRALDGLRGLAAVVVVIHHSLLSVQLFATPYNGAQRADASVAWFTYSPLHLVWAGSEAVYVFFVLSGLVLTLPVLRAARFDWRAYYLSRLARLYLPIWASVALAAVVVAAFPRGGGGGSDWLAGHEASLAATGLVRDLTLITGASGINSALWSLQWEVIFSLLLPLYVWVAVRFARYWPLLVAASLLLTTLGVAAHLHALQHLPMFMLGVVIATRASELRSLGERVNSAPHARWAWYAIAVTAVLALMSYWTLSIISGRGVFRLAIVLVVLGAAALVVLAMTWPEGRRALQSRPVQFLGTVSFSLYLVHEPIVVAVAQSLPPGWKGATVFIALPIAVAFSWIFYRVVERPSHKAAQHLRRRLSSRAVPVG